MFDCLRRQQAQAPQAIKLCHARDAEVARDANIEGAGKSFPCPPEAKTLPRFGYRRRAHHSAEALPTATIASSVPE